MLAMDPRTPLGVRLPALSLTTIATVRRFDMLAPTGCGRSAALWVQLRFTGRTALEAAMGPEVLLWAITQDAFDPLVDAQAVGFLGFAWEAFERRVDHQAIPTPVRQAFLGERHHQRLAQPRELAGGGDGGGLDAEQRHENALLGAIVLVRRIPDRTAGA